ncbi:MAG TPA: hypothetical protein VFP91_20195, partial [Vicinamibacterales bacterium]|nr:hypothetical protein [Vicinamibacterales bacterium]
RAERRKLAELALTIAAVASIRCSTDLNVGAVLPQNGGRLDGGGQTVDSPDARAEATDAFVCRPMSAACTRAGECCSRTCISGVCVPLGTCQIAGTTCSFGSACCSGRCQEEPLYSSKVCGSSCSADGIPCIRAQNCCSLACYNGVCGGQMCKIWEDTCSTNADCCTNICDPITHKCELADYDAAGCQPAGETCAPDAGIRCCYGCNTTLARCAPPPTLCRGIGAACTADSECCRGACMPNDHNVKVCQIPCLADGASCTTAVECCSYGCSGSPSKCGHPDGPACGATGQRCVTHSDCCSQACDDGYCAVKCGLPGVHCSVEDDCCSESCVNSVCR